MGKNLNDLDLPSVNGDVLQSTVSREVQEEYAILFLRLHTKRPLQFYYGFTKEAPQVPRSRLMLIKLFSWHTLLFFTTRMLDQIQVKDLWDFSDWEGDAVIDTENKVDWN
ncbi:hypothetical protein L1887_19611 [Cichorium endivia]|nr:hypothetical protein L1887_19611 [Cichorium endivia]